MVQTYIVNTQTRKELIQMDINDKRDIYNE